MQQMARALGLQPGAQALVTNGRVVPLLGGKTLSGSDLDVAGYFALHLQPGAQVLSVVQSAQAEGRTKRTQISGELLPVSLAS